jgi:ketosteroid isomerase-like protein
VRDTRLSFALGALVSTAVLAGCACLGPTAPSDEELALRLLRDYEAAVAAYDAEAAMALLADDYEGWRGSGKESVGRMVEMMEERGGLMELDLTECVVTVEGDTARVSDVVGLTGRWEMRSTYVLSRSPDGWRIKTVEMQR